MLGAPGNRAIFCALLLLCSTAVAAAEKPAAKKPAGKSETLACRLGTEDRHARIAVVVIGGKTDSFAYYSKWKPRTCSIYVQRNRDSHSKWADNGNITTVNLERGAFLIEHKPGEYHFLFRDIDRERYCGMDGVINGSLIIRRGSEACQLEGDIMVEGVPLGGAHAHVQEEPLPASTQSVETVPISPAKPPVASISAPPQEKSVPIPAPVATTQPPPASAAQPDVQPRAGAPADVPQKPPSVSARATGSVEKPPEAKSSNPFSAFFKSLTQQRPPETEPPPSAPVATTQSPPVAPAQPDVQPRASAPADAAQKPTSASAPGTGVTEKASEAASSNPFSSFFRSFMQQPPPAERAP